MANTKLGYPSKPSSLNKAWDVPPATAKVVSTIKAAQATRKATYDAKKAK